MKLCVYCGKQIADLARKCHHCQSYQSPTDAPRTNLDSANLVITFVGSIAGIATVAAAIFAYFGVRTVDDINKRAAEISARADATLTIANAKLSDFEKQSQQVQKRLNALLVSTQYARFQDLFDNLILGKIDARPDLVDELTAIAKSISDLTDLPDDKKLAQNELIATMKGIELYNSGDYKTLISVILPLPDAAINKHRLLGLAYSLLYLEAKNANQDEDAKKYLEKEIGYQTSYNNRATRANKKTRIAATNLGNSLLMRNMPGDLESGCKYLEQAQSEAPEVWITHYNLAICHVKKQEYEIALDLLDRAKTLGGFSSDKDISEFKEDRDFATLIKNDRPEIRQRVEKLLKR